MDRRRFSRTVAAVLAGVGVSAPEALRRGAPVADPQGALFVASVQALRALDPGPETLVWVLGYYEEGDGGGGLFRYEADSTTPADGGRVLAPGRGRGGRWHRLAVGGAHDGAYNVRWWGAKGDGEHDDSRAIQAAIDALHRRARQAAAADDMRPREGGLGGVVFIPAGTYVLGTGLVVRFDGCRIVGAGPYATVLRAASSFDLPADRLGGEAGAWEPALLNFPGTRAQRIREWEVSRLTLRGHTDDDPASEPSGLTAREAQVWRIDSVNFIHVRYAAYLAKCWVGECLNARVETSQRGFYGQEFVHNAVFSGCRFTNTRAEGQKWAGLQLRKSDGVVVSGCNFERNRVGLRLYAHARGIEVQGNYFENNFDADILLRSAVRPVNGTVQGVHVAGNFFNYFRIKGASNQPPAAIRVQSTLRADEGGERVSGLAVIGNYVQGAYPRLLDVVGVRGERAVPEAYDYASWFVRGNHRAKVPLSNLPATWEAKVAARAAPVGDLAQHASYPSEAQARREALERRLADLTGQLNRVTSALREAGLMASGR